MKSIPSLQSLRSSDDIDSELIPTSIKNPNEDSPRTAYSKLRNAREQATFNLMMRMDPSALEKIRQEFYSRNDEVSLSDFIYIMYKHLIELAEPDSVISQKHQDTRSFVSDMNELFKEVDVNDDQMMEWEEFTKFTVEKASLLNQKFVMATIPEYVESTSTLDNSMKAFRRHDICRMLPMPSIGCFSVLEEHSKDISIYYSLNGRHLTNIRTEAVPLAVDFAKETSTLFASCSNLQINMYQQLPNKRFQFQGVIPTTDTQMSLAWMPTNEILYSGSELGIINCWKPSEKSLIATMTSGHTDICMKLLALDQLDNLVSASMDTTIGVWDTYTNSVITKLRGHRKGVFDMSYNPDYRLLFSCGFDHDAFVWSPFVNSLVFKLKGHHASLVGCHSVENSPEVLTADEDGVFKLWDIRTFQCVQTFFQNSSMDSNEPAEHLCCFFHQNIPTSHRGDEGGEARIYAGSRRIRSFDQKRIVHQRTTDFTNVIWMAINSESFLIFTASDRNLIVWDLLLGSKMIM
jgi:WD40 repeat protein